MPRLGIVVVSIALTQSPTATPFQPWGPTGPRIVNAIDFSADGQTMIVASFPADLARAKGEAPATQAPEVALYESRRTASGWSLPVLLPFAGMHKDYEGTLSPDGSFMLFNSQRPLPDGTPVPNGKNNLWLSRRTATGWSEPRYLTSINRVGTEESYATIARDGRVIYVREGDADAHGPDWDLHVARMAGDDAVGSVPFAPAATAAGESDPWMAPDGSYVIFTRWNRALKWEEDVDLYITFDRGGRWTTAAPLVEINRPGAAEYAVTIAGTPPVIYWKSGGRTVQSPWVPILDAARARAR